MSGGMPELGSKISLISKADIRYEGRLYTVDPQECTIALSSVRSFGTEDRETQFQIAPQSQIYDYILFRGSDIKDIRVVNNSMPHPNDPAIMQVQLPNGQHLMPHFPMPSMNAQHPQPIGAGAYGNPFGGLGAGLGALGGGAGPSMAPGSGGGGGTNAPFMLGGANQPQQQQPQSHQQQHQQQQQQKTQQAQQQQQQKQPNMLTGASRSTTPISLISRKSPSADMGIQVNSQQQQQQQQSHHNQSNNQYHHQNQNNAIGGQSRDAGHKRQNHQQQQQRGGNNQRNGGGGGNNDYYQQQRDRRDSGRNMDNYNNHDSRNNNYNNQRQGGGGQNRNWMMHRGPNNPNNMMRNRGGGGGGGRGRMQNQGYRPMGPGGNQNKPRNPKNTIKFEQDFDFEQANNKFEELRSQLSKLKVGDEPKSEQMNGETDKKDDSGNETGAGEHEPEDEEITVGYDKTKSFFDNISCEAAQDRTKNKKNDWRQERKLNSETFGVSSTRRGSYRGRGGNYFSRNMGNYNGGGGYNRGYRTGNNYRNRNNNRMGNGGIGGVNSNSIATTNGNGTTETTNTSITNKTQQLQTSANIDNAAAAAASAASTTGENPATAAAAITSIQKMASSAQEKNTQLAVVVAGQ